MVNDRPSFDGAGFARTLPREPGIYRMLAADGALLYVGKAIDLRRRVSSYFQSRTDRIARLEIMLSQVASMDFTVTRTEADALVLESRLIKTQNPRYNVALRDDRGYPYLYLSTDQAVPRLRIHRGRRGDKGSYFGPYPSREAARTGLDAVLRGFQLRSCEDQFFRNRSRPCLQHQIGRCSAPCVGKISPPDYQQSVREASDFLSGKSGAVIDQLSAEMEAASLALDFERAAWLRDRIGLLRRVQSRVDVETSRASRDAIDLSHQPGSISVAVVSFREGHATAAQVFHPTAPDGVEASDILAAFLGQFYLDRQVPPEILLPFLPTHHETLAAALSSIAGYAVHLREATRGERAKQLALATRNAHASQSQHLASQGLFQGRRQDLAKMLDMPQPPERIECFDISHTMGESTVASCVVFGPEGAQKSAYRRYNISGITPGDDYAAMHQALTRRFQKEGPLPDLLLIDGGLGQVAQATEVLGSLGITLPVVGIAKGPERRSGNEDLIIADTGQVIHPGGSSPGLLLLIQVRDEAHRFAITKHRQARDKTRKTSPLEKIPGVGPSRRQALLRAFGGIQELRRAGVEELMKIKGIQRETAERIVKALREV